ncbi:MAG: plastocyanin/azurin family copper-binding protein [Thermomicrobiales bacterium]
MDTSQPPIEPSPTADHPSHRRSGRRRGSLRLIGMIAGLLVIAGVLVGVQAMASRYQSSAAGDGLSFVIPDGASQNVAVPTIDSAIDIPTYIVFKEGEAAVLSIRNDDAVANRAGPWVIGPGQTYTAKFDQPGTYQYACTVDPAESVTIVVEGES